MKTHIKKLFLMPALVAGLGPLLLLLALPAMAQVEFYQAPFEYELVGDYDEPGTYAVVEYEENYIDGAATIPNTVSYGGYNLPVTIIGSGALEGNDSLTSVTLPDSITTIESYAFENCSNLTIVTIPDSVTNIGDYAFYQCTSLTSITLGTNVTSIGYGMFDHCTSLTSVTIPSSVTSIGDYAFVLCTSLPKVIIGNGVTSVGDEAFDACSSLTNVTIGSSVTNIVDYAFIECINLTGVYFQGNSPTPTDNCHVFYGDTKVILYVLPSTTGWGSMFDCLPIMTNYVGAVVGGVSNIVGNVTVTHADGTTSTLEPGDPIEMGDTIQTPAGGMAQIKFNDNTVFQMTENASIKIDSFLYNPSTPQTGSFLITVINGAMHLLDGLIGKNTSTGANIQTEVCDIGIRGTEFISQQDPCSSTQSVYLIQGELAITPLDTPGETNICDAPVTIYITPDSVTTNTLTQAMYNSISNQVFQNTGIVTFPSWLEQYFGCTNNPDAAPTADPSGDGEDNYSKFLAGMNPTNSASYFHILSATPEGNNLLVSWLCGGGRTNVLQAATNLSGTRSNLSSNIVLAGSGDSTTNYLDVGAVTNARARFYRVLLVP